jgi:hypothetical protein
MPDGGKSESAVQAQVRLEAAEKDVILFRNNSGALPNEAGRLVRYGLGNDSKAANQVLKSHDLIGLRRVLITQAHVGCLFGQFVSRECKPADWRFGEDPDREGPQLAFGLVMAYGGDAAFTNGRGSL